jgi:hypothetical protein
MVAMVAQANEGIASLTPIIQNLKREMGDEDVTFMQVTRLLSMMRIGFVELWHSSDMLLVFGKVSLLTVFYIFQKFPLLKDR